MRIIPLAVPMFLCTLAACDAAPSGGVQTIRAAGLNISKETRTGLVSGTATENWAIEDVVLRACGQNAWAVDFNIIPSTNGSGDYEFYFRCA